MSQTRGELFPILRKLLEEVLERLPPPPPPPAPKPLPPSLEPKAEAAALLMVAERCSYCMDDLIYHLITEKRYLLPPGYSPYLTNIVGFPLINAEGEARDALFKVLREMGLSYTDYNISRARFKMEKEFKEALQSFKQRSSDSVALTFTEHGRVPSETDLEVDSTLMTICGCAESLIDFLKVASVPEELSSSFNKVVVYLRRAHENSHGELMVRLEEAGLPVVVPHIEETIDAINRESAGLYPKFKEKAKEAVKADYARYGGRR
jgi:hypothetical protein